MGVGVVNINGTNNNIHGPVQIILLDTLQFQQPYMIIYRDVTNSWFHSVIGIRPTIVPSEFQPPCSDGPSVIFSRYCTPLHVCKGMIDDEDQNALESAASEGDAVVHTAFSVAVRSQDLDYLAALLKDIAANKRDAPKVTSLTRDIHAVSTSYVVHYSTV